MLKGMIDSAMFYLQRSLAIMIKSVISRLCGNKATLQKLHEINSKLRRLPEGSSEKSELKIKFFELVNTSCKFWNKDCSENEDWVWHCRKVLPRKSTDPQEEWKGLTEDLKSWKLDVCLKLISRAGFKIIEPNKFKLVNRLEHDKVHLFSSKHICFKTDSYQEYKFVEFADKATEVRNYYAHLSSCADVIESYPQHFKIIENFSIKLLHWVKREDGNLQHVSICEENLLCIQQKHESYLVKHTAKFDSVLVGLKNFNFNHFGYILISTPCSRRAGVTVSKEQIAQLNNIPWSAIVDFDVASRQDGLWDSLCEVEGGQPKLASFQSPNKNIVVPFSYTDINSADRSELNRDGHIPWIFPHGEVQDQNSKACPFNDHQQYCRVVRKPLVNSMRKIASYLTQNKCQGAIGVVLCYGDYGYQSENLPYSNFLSDLKHLCDILLDEGSSVIVLSDSPFLVRYLKPLPVYIIPLVFFCNTIKSKLTFVHDELPPINMPSLIGLRQVTFNEEDLELVHEYIAEHELHRHKVQKMIELQQGDKKISDTATKIDHDIKCELRERFYKGQQVTWISLDADDAITRREESEIMKGLRYMLSERVIECREPGKYVIYHFGGAGATTLARKIVWNFRKDFPCVILKLNYKYTDRKVECTSQALKALYEELHYPVLMLIDEEPFFKAIPRLTGYVQANGTPVVFLQVQRVDFSELRASAEQTVKCTESSWVLQNALHKEDASKLKYKLSIAFGENKIFAGDRRVAEMKSSMVTPNVNDQVTDLKQNGIITKVLTTKKQLLHQFHRVKVDWGDGIEEICIIGSFVNQSNTSSYKSVYLNTQISRVCETFHFYGIMYLDEEFREPMYEHIKKCLNEMLPCLQKEDDLFKQKLLILAYVSMLFAFKVCESIHIKAFEHLCYAVTNTSAPKEFKLETYIPEAGLRFMIITREGQFRIIHPIVAYEIIKFYSRNSSFSDDFPPSFVCDFLNYMLPELEYQNEEAALAVNRLLRYREYVDNGKRNLTKKPFSELILTLDKQDPQHAVEVLHYASELINNCHAYGHYARYMSKKLQDYDGALEILKEAEKLAFKRFDEGVVLNIKGDVYREKLEKYLQKNENLDWKDSNNRAFDLHYHACEACQESYKKHHDDFPLFNELAVRLDLLEAIKKSTRMNEHKFLEFVLSIPDVEVAKSVDTCSKLVKELNEYICSGDGRKDFNDYSDEARLKKYEKHLHSIMGSRKKQKEILYDLMTDTKYAGFVNLPYVRRSYIHLCQLGSSPIQTDMKTCLQQLENNFSSEGHVDQDMINWLLIIRNLPHVGGNTKTVEERLISWKNQGPYIVNAKRNVQQKNNPLWVNFYLTICYFIQLIENKDEEEIPRIVKRFKDAHHTLSQESENNKVRLKIKEWLHNVGSGFMRLKSGQPIENEMLLLKGSAGIPSLQEAQRSRGDAGYPYVSWKGLCIFLYTKRHLSYSFKQGDTVTFGVGFTLSGPQAIVIQESVVSVPTNILAESSEQQAFHGGKESTTQARGQSLAMKTLVTQEHNPKHQQQKRKKQLHKYS